MFRQVFGVESKLHRLQERPKQKKNLLGESLREILYLVSGRCPLTSVVEPFLVLQTGGQG